VLEDRCLLSLGAALVADINPGSSASSPSSLAMLNGKLFFAADGADGSELWVSDGTPAGTSLLKDINTVKGGSSYPEHLTRVGNLLFFNATDGVHGFELWKTDGTAAGTVMVKDINPGGADSFPLDLTNVNGTLFFDATDGVHGDELWKSDGTAAGTVLVKDIVPGDLSSAPQELTDVNGTLFFAARNQTHGLDLWRSDGTAAGTVLVKNPFLPSNPDPAQLTSVNGYLFYTGGVDSKYLFQTNGYATVRLNSIYYARNLTAFNGELYYTAVGASGDALWKTKGTPGSTTLVKVINPNGGAYAGSLTVVDTNLFFSATDGVHGGELWTSDGTAARTMQVKDINLSGDSSPADLTSVNINLSHELFFTADDGLNGRELWRSDGTAAGTFMVRDIVPGTGSSSPAHLTNGHSIAGILFFTADDGSHGTELWKATDFPTPVITSPGFRLNKEGDAVALAVSAGGGTLTYSAVGLPPGLSINAGTGLISGTVGNQAGAPSQHTVTLTVTNEAAFTASTTFTWKVSDPTTPAVASPGDQQTFAGQGVSLAVSASDADGDPLTYAAVGLPSGLSIDPVTGVISGKATTPGTAVVTVRAGDGQTTGSASFSWTVLPNPPPVVTSPGDQGNNEGNTVSLAIQVGDADGDTLTYSAGGLPTGLAINSGTGVIAGTLGNQAAGTWHVTVYVSDGVNTSTTAFLWTVGDLTPPVVQAPGPQHNNEGNTITLAVVAGDADGDPLTFSAANLPPGLSINSSTGKISGTLANQAAGTYQVTVSASDGFNSTSLTFTWTVNDITPPVLANPGNQANTLGDVVTLGVSAGDADGDPLTYSASNLPPGLSIDGGTGVISGTVTASTVLGSPYMVTVFASDGQNTGSVSFLWTFNGVAPGS
jgi:ELWxxDGT repeat protein